MVILAGESGGSLITDRVMFAVATAFIMISPTSLAESNLPALGPSKYFSGGNDPAWGSNPGT
jgi:hypothetical protein